MTQSQLARRLGVSESTVSRIESGKEALSLERAAELAKALGLRTSFLLDFHTRQPRLTEAELRSTRKAPPRAESIERRAPVSLPRALRTCAKAVSPAGSSDSPDVPETALVGLPEVVLLLLSEAWLLASFRVALEQVLHDRGMTADDSREATLEVLTRVGGEMSRFRSAMERTEQTGTTAKEAARQTDRVLEEEPAAV